MAFQRHYAQHQVLGKRLRAARESAGLTQEQAAGKLGVGQSMISNSETGNRRVDVFELQDFAELYNTTLAELLGPLSEIESKELARIEAWKAQERSSS